MVRYLKQNGVRIQLLSAPTTVKGEEEEDALGNQNCPDCFKPYDSEGVRRACIDRCGHAACLNCLVAELKVGKGCLTCKYQRDQEVPTVADEEAEHDYPEQEPLFVEVKVNEEEDVFPIIGNVVVSPAPMSKQLAGEDDKCQEEEMEVEKENDVVNGKQIEDQGSTALLPESGGIPVHKIKRSRTRLTTTTVKNGRNASVKRIKPSGLAKTGIKQGRASVSVKKARAKKGGGTYKCSYCKVIRKTRIGLGKHMTNKHADLRPHPCDICQWPCASKRDLAKHRLTHSNERPYKCNSCLKAFKSLDYLKKHTKKCVVAEQKNTRAIVGEIGAATFGSDIELIELDLESEESNSQLSSGYQLELERHLTCVNCNKKFATKDLRDKHVLAEHLDYYG